MPHCPLLLCPSLKALLLLLSHPLSLSQHEVQLSADSPGIPKPHSERLLLELGMGGLLEKLVSEKKKRCLGSKDSTQNA